MKKILLLLIFYQFSNADLYDVTLKDFIVMIGNKFQKTILIDKELDEKITLVTSANLKSITYFGMVIDVLDDNGLVILNRSGKYYYITKKPLQKRFRYFEYATSEQVVKLANLFDIKYVSLNSKTFVFTYTDSNKYNKFISTLDSLEGILKPNYKLVQKEKVFDKQLNKWVIKVVKK